MRTNIVGTHWLAVTPYLSIAASAASGSKRSITTTVPPICWAAIENRRGAA